jgi:HlyD family secretion protein
VNRRIPIAIAAIVVAATGGVIISKSLDARSGASGKNQYKLTKIDKGQVKKTVSSSGVLQAWRIVDIKARAGGELKYLGVDVGSIVRPNQIIARIDPLDVQLSLNTARADETSAKARKAQSSQTYELQVKQSQIAIADARASLQSAKANAAAANARLATSRQQSTAQPELTRAAIANAKASYDQAVTQREQLDATQPQLRASAKAAYDQAIANRDNARLQLDRQKVLVDKGFVSRQTVDTAQAALTVAESNVLSTKARLDTLDDELRSGRENADARVAQTRASLEQANANNIDIPNRQNAVREAEAAVRQAQAAVARAEVAVRQAIANQANNQIRGFDVAANSAAIARAEASRVNAETTFQRTEIRAPMEGVVLQKYVEQGTIIASALGVASQGQNIVQIGDISKMFVDVTVDETDIANVDVGQKVDLAVEAYPGVPFEGRVSRVDPQAVVLQNVTSVHVRVEVDNSAPTFRLLKPGMNATCEFVIDRKESVLNVPSEAVREDNDGKYVEVGTGGVPAPPDPKTGVPADAGALIDVTLRKARVEIGLEGNENIEIVSGLQEGDMVVTQTIEPVTTPAGGSSPFGGGGFGGGRPGGGGGGGRR